VASESFKAAMEARLSAGCGRGHFCASLWPK
jgi:hypothetical protein